MDTDTTSDYRQKPRSRWRIVLHEIIFEADTPAGKAFDVLLIVNILLSVLVVMLNSVESIHESHGRLFDAAEWFFTVIFTIEYVVRLLCVGRAIRYATSFYGVVDLLAVLPTYLSLLIPGSQHLQVIRILRVLRIFRVLKLAQYVGEARALRGAFRASRRKIAIFLVTVLTLVVILGSVMYLIEGRENGFESIPHSVYWAIVTLTTVGYGDISPQTGLGRTLAAMIMILGYSIIAIPTGIVSAELVVAGKKKVTTQVCPHCCAEGHDNDAKHCKHCGAKL
ncbi:MAG: ion transporter [Phycisphaerae bacterium]|nr:ion transporter [Phycisphaerae bacterium]